jgi:uroporphyrinogen-III decarboxylase
VDGIGPLEPAAGNDLIALRGLLGPRITLVGNIDVDLLSRGGQREVEKAAGVLVAGMAGSPFILSSGNTITASVNPRNFSAMVEAGRSAFHFTT